MTSLQSSHQLNQLFACLLTIPCMQQCWSRTQLLITASQETYLHNSMSQQRLNHLALLSVHRDRLFSIDIDVIAREFVVKSENRLATFGCIWITLHFVPEVNCSIPQPDIQWYWITFGSMFVCDITTSTWNTAHAIYKVKQMLCFRSKMAANGKDREWGEGCVGNMRVQCKRTWSPSTYSPLLRLWYWMIRRQTNSWSFICRLDNSWTGWFVNLNTNLFRDNVVIPSFCHCVDIHFHKLCALQIIILRIDWPWAVCQERFPWRSISGSVLLLAVSREIL